MNRGKVALALGSGGAKGFAHVGVLKAFEECGIPVDIITGSSMGSLVASFYVTGMRPTFMERLARTLTWRHWVDVTVPRVGLVSGRKVHELVSLLTRGATFEEAQIPCAIVSTELTTKSLVTFRSGKLADAVRASISIPGVFVPFVTEQGVFVDGGVMERVPVQAAKDLGADVVIAVDVAAFPKRSVPETMLDVISLSLEAMQEPHIGERLRDAAICIRPVLTEIGSSQFNKASEAIDLGYEAAMALMPEIRLKLQQDAGCEEMNGQIDSVARRIH